MYKLIGADGKEYGPANAEQIRQWINEGRANARTRAKLEVSEEWKTLGDFPEFADILATQATAASAAPPLSPRLSHAETEALSGALLARDYRLAIGHCIGRGWALVKQQFWLLVGGWFLVFAVECGMGAVPILGTLAAMVLGGVLNGGLFYLFLKTLRGRSPEIGEVFAGFSLALVPLMLAGILKSLLTSLGFLLCILPGIYLAVAWTFALPLVIDKQLDFWPAMELSRKMVSKHWWTVLGLWLVIFLVVLLGLLACLVGFFVAMPVTVGALAYAYEDIFGEPAPPGT